ncbi:hypothetical protein SAOR_07095 [Salinisphaera orenii MK-B5]|uniref:Uncharacterized protein n=1 Tax=Salinisphaera orenii MK-B5 TaxID=856730 RepID=A0A423PQE7_9GAMM|nr:hypothetical protein SAOR_07095 [Salinisphaera orenii MK-B5]
MAMCADLIEYLVWRARFLGLRGRHGHGKQY